MILGRLYKLFLGEILFFMCNTSKIREESEAEGEGEVESVSEANS